MAPTTYIWLLFVDDDFQKIGDCFPVETTADALVYHLKEKVQESQRDLLHRALVAPTELIAWKTKGLSITNETTPQRMAEILRKIANDQDIIEELAIGRRVAELGLLDGHVLLIQLPVVFSGGRAAGHSIPAKRKPELSEEYLKRILSNKMAEMSPSRLNEYSEYATIQKDTKQKILDDHPEPDVDTPPLPLLYSGFGHFLDSTSLAAIQSGTSSHPDIEDDVDRLVARLCKIEDEKAKQEGTQDILHDILFRARAGFKYSVKARRATDRHISAAHGGPIFIVEYKRQMDVAEPQLAGYFLQLAVNARAQIVRGWRQLALGIVIRGSFISFLGLIMIDTQVRMLPITPTFPCTDSALESRASLYAAFSAARDLVGRIAKDAKEFVETTEPELQSAILHKFPNIQSLRRCQLSGTSQQEQRIAFQIIESLGNGVQDRFLYVAKCGPKTIMVKFWRMYGKELHEFCAARNYAPQLLAFERLPGGWYAIAMEYHSKAVRIDNSPLLVQHGEIWLKHMDDIVTAFHEHGFVHGDLRPPNFIVDEEKLLLIDFDWGGKEGEAKFPDAKLIDMLRDSRDEKLVQKRHDVTVLAITKAIIKNKITLQR